MNFEDLEQEALKFFSKLGEPDNKTMLEETAMRMVYAWSLKRNLRKSVSAVEKFRRGEPLDKKDIKAFTEVATALPFIASIAMARGRQSFSRFYEAMDNVQAQRAADKATAEVMKEESPIFTSGPFDTPDEPTEFKNIEDFVAWATKRSK